MIMGVSDKKRVIVSLTSYPKRIGCVRRVLETIYLQTMQPDKVVLWLAKEQFPNGEQELPGELYELVHSGKLEIRWCDDLKPHKKYFYAFQEYPDDLVITIDDDVLYPSDMIETLYQSYLKHPNAVSAMRTHLMVYDRKMRFLPYKKWVRDYDECIGKASHQLFCTGCGGVLYPVHLFDRKVLDKRAIEENCLMADDIWLKLMELMSNVPVVLCSAYSELQMIDDSQEAALYFSNETANDAYLKNSLRWYEQNGYDCLAPLRSISPDENLLTVSSILNGYMQRIDRMEKIPGSVDHSRSFKIVRFVTRPWRAMRRRLKE